MNPPDITTPRLKLSPLAPSDAPALFAYRSDPAVSRYQSFEPRTVEDATSFIGDPPRATFDIPGVWCQLGIRDRDSGLLVGDLGVHVLSDDPRQVEIGFTVAPAHQGRGLGTEAVTGLLDALFLSLRKHRVFASVDPRNVPSMALLRRVGMRQEAHFRESLWFKGEWADDAVFAVLRSEWLGRAGRGETPA